MLLLYSYGMEVLIYLNLKNAPFAKAPYSCNIERNRRIHSKLLMHSLNICNNYQINLLKILIFMHHVKNDSTPIILEAAFKFPSHQYLTGFARSNFV